MEFIAGMRNPGSATLGIRPDPESASHVKMFELSQMDPSKVVTWLVGWSDGTEPPTVDVGGELTLPNTRTWLKLNGYISEYPFDFQLNATVTGDLSIKRTSGLEWIKKGVTP